MSPTAYGGPPHSRASSVNAGGPISAENGVKVNGLDGAKGAGRVYPHLEDLVAVRPDVDVNASIRKLLAEGETLAKQADTHLDFRRPEVALPEFVKASIITVELIPRHADWPAVQQEQGDLYRLHSALLKRISTQHPKFADVRETIKEDNARSGVKPILGTGMISSGMVNGHTRVQSVQNPTMNGTSTNGTAPRKKPPVQPKPDGLHGKAIHQASGSTASSPQDLAARFARLRSPEVGTPVQDSRIRTQPIPVLPEQNARLSTSVDMGKSISKPVGLRDMPSVPKTIPRPTKITVEVDIPGMPRPPDAVYHSPARGSEPSTNVNLLTMPRNPSYLGNRNNSAPPISTVGPTPTPGLVDSRRDYFSPAHTTGSSQNQQYQRKPQINLPDSTVVTPEDLMSYLGKRSQGLQLLLVDLRSREDFDAGHIMSKSIICVEPITLQTGISGDELNDKMLLAPDAEQKLFHERDEFDLIVFYDQSSTSYKLSSPVANFTEGKLRDFAAAVYDYGYEKKIKRRPMLLVGGLDAWVDLLGPNSLQTSNTGTSENGVKRARPIGRVPMARANQTTRKRVYSRPLTNDEEKQWDQTLREEEEAAKSPIAAEASAADELVYARTAEDFLRRFPDLPAIQESMTSPIPHPSNQLYHNELADITPRPPARPPPALPRQRSSGISERGPTAAYAHTVGTPSRSNSITDSKNTPGLCGLWNPGNLCYMNAALQSLSNTPQIREYLLHYQHPGNPPVPIRAGESTNPPQLMVRCLQNLLGHIWSGMYDYVKPATFTKYVNSVHSVGKLNSRNRNQNFGGNTQQDSTDFLNWLIDILDDELNPLRDRIHNNPPDDIQNEWNKLSPRDAAFQASQFIFEYHDSIITREFKGLLCNITTCNACHHASKIFQTFSYLTVNIDHASQQTLQLAMRNTFGGGSITEIEDFTCDNCKKTKITATRNDYIAHFPNTLILELSRYDNDGKKKNTTITFPERHFSLSNCQLPSFPEDSVASPPAQQKGDFNYDTYAVIQHEGATINSGHYWSLAKSMDKSQIRVNGAVQGPGLWHRYNDSIVSGCDFGATQTKQTVAIFMRRQGT